MTSVADEPKCCGVAAAPAGKPMSAAWDGMAGWYTTWMSPGTASIAMSLYGHLGLLSNGESRLRVLETHCGDAKAATGLLPSPRVASYTAVDFSQGMLAVASANLGERAATVMGDSMQVPFEDSSFDRYLSNLGLCCVADMDRSLAEAYRVLAPGGIAAMSLRIEGGEGDTSMRLVSDTLAQFGMEAAPHREGIHIGKDLPALRAKVEAAGFQTCLAWRAFATLPIHDTEAFMAYATAMPPTAKFLEELDGSGRREGAEEALRVAAAAALAQGAIQLAVAVVVAKK